MTTGRLKLRATSAEELEVISACLQDAIVPLADMTWMRDQRRFVMVLNRFCWERAGEAPPFERTHAMLSFQNVEAVRTANLEQAETGRLLSLLALAPDGDDAVHVAFAGEATIRVEARPVDCVLEDLGEPWPTRWRPGHGEPADAP